MRRNSIVKGFDYRTGQAVSRPWGEWQEEIAAVEAAGGRQERDPDGTLAVYPKGKARLLEVYDRG